MSHTIEAIPASDDVARPAVCGGRDCGELLVTDSGRLRT